MIEKLSQKLSLIQLKTFSNILLLILFFFNIIWAYLSFKNQGIFEKAQIPLTRNPIIFQDDRDGWLRAAYALTYQEDFRSELWQINFWPPGQVSVITAIFFVCRNYILIIMCHTVLTLLILNYIYASILRSPKNFKYFLISSIFVIAWNFSFINLSSITTLVLCPDYISALVFFSALILITKYLQEEKQNFILPAVLLVIAAFLRVTYYQVILLLLVYCLVIFCYRVKTFRYSLRNQAKKLLKILLISVLLILPWIGFRAIYSGNDLYHALQLSEQGRFAMGVQWWDKKYRFENNAQYIGAGVACDLNPKKCIFFSERDLQIKNKKINIDWGTDLDEKTEEALKTFASNPLEIVKLKAPILLRGYFQRIAFSSIDSHIYLSLDRILLIPFSLFSCLIAFRNRNKSLLHPALFVCGIVWILTLFVTQVEFRYFLPSIVLLLFPAIDSLFLSRSFRLSKHQNNYDNSRNLALD